ncbi:lytic murein transglycosylase [Kribbella solani]|uniref:lytic murein transglycosylase n=1 Tax=Kribbella solani TaxID=236067 RepID=UPI0029AFE6B4|nr:lytic murein transglycosylase [Kribbella solani]MDX2968703.1 lytic murein transglycosylase [Kribbella solani]
MAKGKRRATGGGWRQVAPLIPVALFASAFTVSATDDPAIATASLEQGGGGNPVVVPKQPIAVPANVPVPGQVGPGVGAGEPPNQVVSGLSRNGIPNAALKAYSRAQQVLAQADPSCHLPWTLVAAIGRVESNHGRFGGNSLNSKGVAVPGIFGPRLDGSGGTAKIADTDAGAFDGDGAFDRAVGPMQFIPGTWRAVGVDGDGDGVRNPQDINDAAMSTGVYLCSGSTDLSKASDLNAALLRYNHSQSYADLVISIAKAYAGGSWIAVGNGTSGDDVDTAGEQIGDPKIDAPADKNLPKAIDLPTTPPGKPIPTATDERDGSRPTVPTQRPTTPAKPSDKPTPGKPTPSRPTMPGKPTTKPTTPTTTTPPGLVTLKTAAGLIVGTVGSTLHELQTATTYCQSEMSKVTITKPTQDQLQKCVTAYQTGGAKAVDQVIRNLLSLLGLLGVLGGGILGS